MPSFHRRLVAVAGLFLALLALCQARLYILALDSAAYSAVRRQSGWSQTLTDGRGDIFDCDLRPLTGTASQAAAVVTAGARDYTLLYGLALPQDRQLLYQGVQGGTPFVVRLSAAADTAAGGAAPVGAGQAPGQQGGVFTCSYPLRYAQHRLAGHIIGYCNGEGVGVSGAERAFDSILQGGGDTLAVHCTTNALTQATGAVRMRRTQGSGAGIQLSLDSVLQRICQDVAAQHISNGAIVVLESATGRIKASVSMPEYDPGNVAASIEAGDTALINRAFSSFNVGSVYKPLLAALALEKGWDADAVYECSGAITVDGHTYRCARRAGHGEIDLAGALQQSCNCYFIWLGRQLPVQDIVDFSSLCGLGSATQLGGGWQAGAGNLPDAATLANSGELAGLCFGQGKLTATPLQMAAAFNIFANGGVYISPTLAQGVVNSNTRQVVQSWYRPQQLHVISEETAEEMRQLLAGVVEQGLGAAAAIPETAVAGKTGTAQTGRSRTNADGSTAELYESWFVGFYPADAPRYTIAVMVDATTLTGEAVAPVFAALCRQLYYLENP